MKSIHLTIRHTLLTGIVLLLAGNAASQNAPGGLPRSTAVPVAPPAAYTNSVVNFVRVREPSIPLADPASVTSTSRTVKEVKQSTQYIDGLGRPFQSVSKGMSGNIDTLSSGGRDIVSMQLYDILGRETLEYLPYVQQSGNNADGKYKTAPFSEQATFYQNTSLSPGAQGESVYYTRRDFEASPLRRLRWTYAPGNSWAKNDLSTVERGGNKPQVKSELVNATVDSVRMWSIPAGSAVPVSAAGSAYQAGTLFKDVTQDEAGNKVVEYINREGQLVLKKTQLSASPGTAHVGWLCTYFVYDRLNNIRFVITPKAVEEVNSNWVITPTVAAELCYQYTYDHRKRMIARKTPGAEPVYMVFDARDRLALSQNGNQRAVTPTREWLVTFYDGLNRVVMTASYPSNATREQLQATMDAATPSSTTITTTTPGPANLVVATRETGITSYKASASVSFQSGFETETGADFVAEIDPSYGTHTTTLTVSNPLPGITGYQPLTYHFYDHYNYSGRHALETADLSKPQGGNNTAIEAAGGASNMTKGFETGTRLKVLGTTDQWLTTTNWYDNKGRLIQQTSDNIGGGKDVVTYLYDFKGKELSTYQRHKNLRSGVTPQTTVLTMNRYDAAGRLRSVKQRLNDNATLERVIAVMDYDELGRLRQKRLGATSAGFLETLVYENNLRGWLKSVNAPFVNTANSTSNWFGFDLSYDHGFSINQYNSNIAGAKWKSKSNGIARAYGFEYDGANRLRAADFNQQNSGSATWQKNLADFSVSNLAYDANGNIVSMKQMGLKAGSIATVDQLTYAYYGQSNRLRFVRDNTNDPNGILGDFKEPAANNASNLSAPATDADYNYDANGNLTIDKNKGITAISYNYLNLPQTVSIEGKGTISYKYGADGSKLRKTVTDNTVTPARQIVTDYSGDGFVYQNDTLQFQGHRDGRVRTVFQTGQPLQFKYDYFVKDHQDNVRMVLTEQTDFTMYAASMEPEQAALENALFSNIDNTRSPRPTGYPEDRSRGDNAYVAKLNGKTGGKKIGPSLVLRVMAGDTIEIGARAFYKSMGPEEKKQLQPATDIVNALAQAFGGSQPTGGNSHGGGGISARAPFDEAFIANQYQRLKEKDQDGLKGDRPRAYLNFVLFDDQFNLVSENSGVRQVKPEPDQLQTLSQARMPVAKTGFLYVYTSNESQQDVFFDNVTVLNITGPLLEESHYYPFGVAMHGISSKAPGRLENKYKFNGGTEISEDLGVNWYETEFRNYDAQIGRFHQIDGLAEYDFSWSPYSFGHDNPYLINDPLGLTSDTTGGQEQFWVDEDGNRTTMQLKGITVGGTKKTSMGQPGFLESLIPVWGSGRAAIDDFQNGRWGWGIFNSVMVVADLATLGVASTAFKTTVKVIAKEGVYVLAMKSGKTYVGQSKNILKRIKQHFAKRGKLNKEVLEKELLHEMPGSTKTEREIYEQYLIDKHGIDNLVNSVNPMGGRRDEYLKKIDEVIEKYKLPR